jgi:hypothetical protein
MQADWDLICMSEISYDVDGLMMMIVEGERVAAPKKSQSARRRSGGL